MSKPSIAQGKQRRQSGTELGSQMDEERIYSLQLTNREIRNIIDWQTIWVGNIGLTKVVEQLKSGTVVKLKDKDVKRIIRVQSTWSGAIPMFKMSKQIEAQFRKYKPVEAGKHKCWLCGDQAKYFLPESCHAVIKEEYICQDCCQSCGISDRCTKPKQVLSN